MKSGKLIVGARCQGCYHAIFRYEPAGLSWIPKEGDWLRCSHQNDKCEIFETGDRMVDRVGDAVRRNAPLPARDACWQDFGQDNPTKATCYPPSQLGTHLKGRIAANNYGEAITMSADCSSDLLDGSRIRHGSIAKLGHCSRPGYCVPPRRVCRQNDRGDARRLHGGMVGVDDHVSHSFSSVYSPDPVRHRLRERIHVAGEWSVELQVVRGVIVNDVNDWSAGSLRVVQIGKAIR